jgi:peptidoglycan hydrolase-like protein with peptidoglycan-binding domain
LGGSDHEDPIDYFAKWGLTWNAFCAKVETYYNGILGINQPAPVKTHLPLPTGIIRQGNKGDNVKQLQTALNSIGYPCTADGDFGPKTKAALVAFQKNVSISADGIYGPTTRAYMLKYV